MNGLTYRVYRLASGLRHHVPRLLTRSGLLFFSGMILTGLASFDMDRSVAYQAFAFQFCLLTIAFGFKWFFRGRFTATRQLPRFASVGLPFQYEVQVRHASGRVHRDLEVFEELSDPRPSRREFEEWMRPDSSAPVQSFRIKISRPAFRSRDFRRASVAPAPLSVLPANGAATAKLEVMPLRRGVLRFDGLSIARPDALGLMRGFKRVSLPGAVLVLPRRYPVPALNLAGPRQYQRGGVTLAGSIGESEEFISLRDYRPGDPLRHIHWRSWARTGRPIVREHQDEFVPRHALILDTFASPAQDLAFEEAVSVAASFACTVDTQESLLDLLFVGAKAICFTTGRGLGQAEQALEILASVQRNGEQPFEVLRRLVLQHAPLVCGGICVFLAWDEERRDLVRRLRQLGLPILVLVVESASSAREPALFSPEAGVYFLSVGKVAEGLARLEGAG